MAGGGGFWPSVRIVLAIRYDITLVGARRVYLLQGHTHTYAYARGGEGRGWGWGWNGGGGGGGGMAGSGQATTPRSLILLYHTSYIICLLHTPLVFLNAYTFHPSLASDVLFLQHFPPLYLMYLM